MYCFVFFFFKIQIKTLIVGNVNMNIHTYRHENLSFNCLFNIIFIIVNCWFDANSFVLVYFYITNLSTPYKENVSIYLLDFTNDFVYFKIILIYSIYFIILLKNIKCFRMYINQIKNSSNSEQALFWTMKNIYILFGFPYFAKNKLASS